MSIKQDNKYKMIGDIISWIIQTREKVKWLIY